MTVFHNAREFQVMEMEEKDIRKRSHTCGSYMKIIMIGICSKFYYHKIKLISSAYKLLYIHSSKQPQEVTSKLHLTGTKLPILGCKSCGGVNGSALALFQCLSLKQQKFQHRCAHVNVVVFSCKTEHTGKLFI